MHTYACILLFSRSVRLIPAKYAKKYEIRQEVRNSVQNWAICRISESLTAGGDVFIRINS